MAAVITITWEWRWDESGPFQYCVVSGRHPLHCLAFEVRGRPEGERAMLGEYLVSFARERWARAKFQ